MPELPAFQTIEEAAAWAETHDTAPYFDQMEDVPPFQAERPHRQRARLSLYLSHDVFAKLRSLARQKQLDYRTLAEIFIVERLLQET
jgi:hypothetical protein